MATTAPFVKLLRQLSGARDDYRTGAFDITWDGAKATLYLVFGQPNHATLQTSGGRRIEGEEVLTALVNQLPPRFQISPWRKEVVRTETLRCTMDELIEPFAQMAGTASPVPETAERDGGGGATAAPSDLGLGLDDFPLLPLGPSLWADASASVVHLDTLVPNLPDALIVVTGPRLRAAGVVIRHRLVDAVWTEDGETSIGETAVMALMGTTQGSVSGYQLASPELAEALTMLWRYPVAYRTVPAAWIRPESLIADLERRRRDCALVVSAPTRGVALFTAGRLIGAYAEGDRVPAALPERVVTLLATPGATVTVRQHADEPRREENLPETAFHAFVGPAGAEAGASSMPESVASGAAEAGPAPASGPASGLPELPAALAAPPGTPFVGGGDVPAALPDTPPQPPPPPPPPPQTPPPGMAAPPWFAGLSGPVEDGVATPRPPGPPFPLPGEPADDGAGYQAVKRDLIQIGTLWLGDSGGAQAAELISRARPSVEDIMSTIDAIAATAGPDHEPSVVQAMAREMRFHAAEHLSGL